MLCRYLALSLVAGTLLGCAGTYQGTSATADLAPASGSKTSGKVHFSQHESGTIKIAGQVSGLTPNAQHGFHIHEKGDCSSPDASSAGAHFNPAGATHGKHGQAASHAGDLPNLQANENGMAIVQFETQNLHLTEHPHSILRKALIVHAQADDHTSQPAGNAGARIACGVITRQ